MHHIHITHDKAAEFLRACDNLAGFIDANSIMGQLIIAMHAALAADGVSVDVWQGDTSIPKNNHVEELERLASDVKALEHLANVADEIRRNSSCELPSGVHMILTRALEATGRK